MPEIRQEAEAIYYAAKNDQLLEDWDRLRADVEQLIQLNRMRFGPAR